MAPRSSGPSREPFKALCEDLSSAVKGGGTISLPVRTIDRITQYIEESSNQPVFSEERTNELLSILDSGTGDACARLDAHAFVVIFQTFLAAETSRPGERGMYLLADGLHKNLTSGSPKPKRNLQKNMRIITIDLFQELLQFFTTSDGLDNQRIWVGLMLIQLLKECPESKNQMTRTREDTKRRLGVIVIEEGDEILRIICGKLLTACNNPNFTMKDFWPKNENPEKYAKFPKPQENSTWNLDFQKWVRAEAGNEVQKHLHYSQRVNTTNGIFEVLSSDVDMTIVISSEEDGVDRELSIYAQADGQIFDRRLDIPLKLVKRLDCEPEGAPFDLVITIMGPTPDDMCFINASSDSTEPLRKIQLTLRSKNDVISLRSDIRKAAKLRPKRELGVESRKIPRNASAHSQDSQESNQSKKSSQSAEALYLVAEEEEGEVEVENDEANSHEAALSNASGPDGSPQALVNHVPSDAEEDPDSPESQANGKQRSAYLSRLNLLHSDARSEMVASPSGVNADENLSVNDRRSTSSDILQNSSIHETKPPRQFSRDKKKTKAGSNSPKVDNQEKDRKRIAATKTVATTSTATSEAPLQPRRGRNSQSNTIEEAAKNTEKKATGKATAMKAKDRMALASSQELPQKPSTSAGDRPSRPTKSRVTLATKGKGVEKLSENSGVSTEKSKSRTLHSPEAAIFGQSTSSITSPDFHDASTPKTAKNVLFRAKSARAMEVQNAAVGMPSNLSNAAIDPMPQSAGTISNKSATKLPTVKKYSLKAKRSKPAIVAMKAPAKIVRKKVAAHEGSDMGLPHEDDAVAEKAPANPKALAQKSSNRSMANSQRKSERDENEQDDSFWEPQSDDEIPEKPAAKSKGASKTSKAGSKAPATSSKATGKKTASKKSQSKPAPQDTIKAVPRNRRKAAVSAAVKISQITTSDAESEDENENELDNAREAVVEKVSQATGSKQSKKPVKIPDAVSKKGKNVETAASKSKTGKRAIVSGAVNEKSIARTSQATNMGEASDDLEEQQHEDVVQLSPNNEHFDLAGHTSPAGSPPPRVLEKSTKKQRNKVAVGLTDLLEDIEINKIQADVSDVPRKKRSRLMNVKPDEQRSKDKLLPGIVRNLGEGSSVMQFSASPDLHDAFVTPHAKGDDQEKQGAAQPDVIQSLSASKIGEDDASEAESSTFKRRRLEERPNSKTFASGGIKTRGRPAKHSAARKKIAEPLRRSPRLLARVTETSTVLNETIVRGKVLLDDRMIRKTPIIAFGKDGPRNQGVSSSKKATTVFPEIVIYTPTPREDMPKAGMGPIKQPKRKREDESGLSDRDGRPAKRPSLPPVPEILSRNNINQSDSPPVPRVVTELPVLFQHHSDVNTEVGYDFPDPGTPSSQMDEDVLDPRAVEAANLEVEPANMDVEAANMEVGAANTEVNNFLQKNVGSGLHPLDYQTPDVPDASPTPVSRYKKPSKSAVDKLKGETQQISGQTGARKFGTELDHDGFYIPHTISKSTNIPHWSSNAKAKPAAPGVELGRYVAHRMTGDDEYEGIASKKLVQSQGRMSDPFLIPHPRTNPHPRINPSNFVERLRASRTQDVEPSLPVPLFKPMQRSKSENDKSQLAKKAEYVEHEAHKKPIVPTKTFGMIPEPGDLVTTNKIIQERVENVERQALGSRLLVPEESPIALKMAKGGGRSLEHSLPGLRLPVSEEPAAPPKITKGRVENVERSVPVLQPPMREEPTVPPNIAEALIETFERGVPDLRLPVAEEPTATSEMAEARIQISEGSVPGLRLPVQEEPAILLNEAKDRVENVEHSIPAVRPNRKIFQNLEYQTGVDFPPVPKPVERTALRDIPRGPPGNSEQDVPKVQPKRKISHELEDDQANASNQPKRRKHLRDSQPTTLEATDQELQNKDRKQVAKLDPSVDKKVSSQIEEGRKVLPQFRARDLDEEAQGSHNESSYALGNQHARRLAHQPVELPLPKRESRAHERRKGHKKSFSLPKEHAVEVPVASDQHDGAPPRGIKSLREKTRFEKRQKDATPTTDAKIAAPKETEDFEKTLVNNASPTSSESSSGSSNLTFSESAEASPEPTEISVEEEWGIELRAHDRPILENLYRIAKGLVSHLVGQREAIEDIVDDYITGGTELIEMLENNHNSEKDRVLADFESAKAKLSESYSNAQRTISKGSKEVKASPMTVLEKQWREQHDDLQSFISESMGEDE